MLGYLNAPSPFDAEGFFDTGDLVETDGEWVRFLGRKSDVINVGGNKVHPAEVESVLLQMDNVADAVVGGAAARDDGPDRARPSSVSSHRSRRSSSRCGCGVFCADRLASFKVPAKRAGSPTSRFIRRGSSASRQATPRRGASIRGTGSHISRL